MSFFNNQKKNYRSHYKSSSSDSKRSTDDKRKHSKSKSSSKKSEKHKNVNSEDELTDVDLSNDQVHSNFQCAGFEMDNCKTPERVVKSEPLIIESSPVFDMNQSDEPK